MKKTVLVFTAIILMLQLITIPRPVKAVAPDPNDNFDDNSLDINKWLIYATGSGSVRETNQELQMELTSASTGPGFEAGVYSNWTIGGDFDIQVDYHLIIWPENNGIFLGLHAGPPTTRGAPDVIVRYSGESGEIYFASFSDGGSGGKTPTNHTSGKLRLARIGSIMYGYYYDAGEWILIHSAPTSTGNGTVRLNIWGHWSTPGVLVAFDNFQVNYGQIGEMTREEEVYTPTGITPYFTMHVVYMRETSPWNLTVIHQMLRTMAQNLASIGIEVHLHFLWMEPMFLRIWSGKLFEEGGYDAAFFGWSFPPESTNTTFAVAQNMHDIYHSSNMPGNGTGKNTLMWNNTENDALLDAAVASTNETEIKSLLYEWQALFYQEQPAALVYYRNSSLFGPLSVFTHLAFNMRHPVFGTGIATPLGQNDSTRAYEAARYVRQAMSHTIDREWTASNLPPEGQPAQQGITPISPAWPGFDPTLQPYAFNLTEARRLLSLAGYGMTITGSSPISLWVTDSLGRHVGVDPQTGNIVAEIPWAYYSGIGTRPQVIYIPWAQGQYTIQVTGTETGAFTLGVTQITEQKFTGVVTTNTTYVYTSTVSSAGAETLTPEFSIELNNMKDYISALAPEAFVTNPDQLRGALNHKIDEVVLKIESGSFEEALNKLTNDVYPKVTGVRYDYYASGGVKAWIVDPAIQEVLQKYLQQITEDIEEMQTP